MSSLLSRQSLVPGWTWSAESRQQGFQLTLGVVAAFMVSKALRLPESLWAVMTVLLVMRPVAGLTLGAGWARVGGTVVGAACGLAGAALQHLTGVDPFAATLAVVAGLAFVGAAAPMLRSAPVAALIVLAAGHIAGHSMLAVAGLRVAQIGIGAGVALGLSWAWARCRAGARLKAGLSALLARLAKQMAAGPEEARPEAAAEASEQAVRQALGRMGWLAEGADHERHLVFPRPVSASLSRRDPRHHRRLVQSVTRVVHDASLLQRCLQALPARPEGDAWRDDVRQAAAVALAGVADRLGAADPHCAEGEEEQSAACLAWLHRLVEATPCGEDAARRLVAGPMRLLLDDLDRLHRQGVGPLSR